MTPFWDDAVAVWVSQRIPGCERGFGPSQAMGVEHAGRTVAGLVFHNWEPESELIEVSAAADDRRWFTRRVVNFALSYVFDRMKCQLVVARQSLETTGARRCWLALGGTEYIIPRLRGRDQDGSIITLTDDQWRMSKFYKEA